MTYPIFRPSAAADVEDAFLWYESQRPGLCPFLEELDAVVHAIAENPHRFPVIHRDARRALLHRFPYALFYRTLSEGIVAVACLHGARNPRHSRTRR